MPFNPATSPIASSLTPLLGRLLDRYRQPTTQTNTITSNNNISSPLLDSFRNSNTINLGQIEAVTPVPEPTPQQFVPPTLTSQYQTPATYSNTSTANPFGAERDKLAAELSEIETRLGGTAKERQTMLEERGVFDDVRRLNELRSALRTAEDRAIEIPLEARRDLPGGATIRDFENRITAPTEENLLRQLSASRAVQDQTAVINTNLALVNDFFSYRTEADNFLYEQKTKRLNNIETAYSDYLTEQQKIALEERKATLATQKTIEDREWKAIEAMATAATERGDFQTASKIFNARSVDEAFRIGQQATGMYAQDTAVGFVDQIDDILSSKGLGSSVGPAGFGLLTRNALDPNRTSFLAKVDQLFEGLTNEAIVDLRSKAPGLGTFTDKDRAGLANAQAALTQREAGEPIKMTESAFRDALNTVKKLQQKDYISSKIGNEAFRAGGWRDASEKDINDYFNLLRSQETSNVQQNSAYDSYFNGGGQSAFVPRPNRNNNPGNVKIGGLADRYALKDASGRPVVDDQNHLIFPDTQSGIRALEADIRAKLTGNSRYVPANPTLAQLGSVYAEDGNWARGVARILGVSPNVSTSSIPFNDLIVAITTQEGWNPYLV